MSVKAEAGTLILRVVLGIIFFVHGLVKFQGGIGNTVGWFDSIGIPGGIAYIVAIIELVGGIALIVGFGTKIVSALLALLMIGAILKVKLAVGFLGNGQMAGYELDLALLAIALYLAINGSKRYSLGQLIGKNQN
ncbi:MULTISPECIES: DoxX family protein [Bacillaceae]|uniref:Oxidoreductase n=1 Tax=Domibacillus aminovorans TaxID=29332 RepID=A0A177KZI0_9BACI|nr:MULTISPECIES: DoxX family protein [Bacillaceae]OAH58546.1 oxidoreductase [Domibacillus aminovorans]